MDLSAGIRRIVYSSSNHYRSLMIIHILMNLAFLIDTLQVHCLAPVISYKLLINRLITEYVYISTFHTFCGLIVNDSRSIRFCVAVRLLQYYLVLYNSKRCPGDVIKIMSIAYSTVFY